MDKETDFKIVATIVASEGTCTVGHKVGDAFEISCYHPGGLCGWFYHDIFPSLQTFQFGGKLPWWKGDVIEVRCPDPFNLVTMTLEKIPHSNLKK